VTGVQVAEQTAAAKREAELAAASVAGLAFEDKLKLMTALQPEPLAALVGKHCTVKSWCGHPVFDPCGRLEYKIQRLWVQGLALRLQLVP